MKPIDSVILKISSMFLLLIGVWSIDSNAQTREYRIHSRGMLHQTVFNSGELGRAYNSGASGVPPDMPSFEWPSNSAVTRDMRVYTGQHNSFGGGVYISASKKDTSKRVTSLCGAISGEPITGFNSFPISIKRDTNFQVLPDGSLNPFYNPDEAEEIITSKWASSTGITVTRVSRAWSMPDYDDFIIYEYEFENTGDVDGNPATPAQQDTLIEVIVGFGYGFAAGKFGYELYYNQWIGDDYYRKNNYFHRFDRRRWLNYALDRDGRPMSAVDPASFVEWATTGKYGGGLLAPQAVGFEILYFDTSHLADSSETKVKVNTTDVGVVWDANGHLKQPFLNRAETPVLSRPKIETYSDISQSRKQNPYNNPIFGPDWNGRGSFNVRQAYNGVGKIFMLGPYILKPGEKIRVAIAEVAGYGAARLEETRGGLMDEGGSCGENCGESLTANAFNPVPNWWQDTTFGLNPITRKFGSTYLSNYSLPQYVNSNTVTIREVADRAIQAYTNQPFVDYDSLQYWPETAPAYGVYKLPQVVPAPVFTFKGTINKPNQIVWGTQVESFNVPNLQAPFNHYEVMRASHPLGPWIIIDSVGKRDPRFFTNSEYVVNDTGVATWTYNYYAIVSVNTVGGKSGKTNMVCRFVEDNVLRNITPQSGDSIAIKDSTLFRWRSISGADRYWLQIASDSSFNTSLFSDSNITSSSYTIPLNIPSGIYYWRIMAINSYERSPWSAIWNFKAVADPPTVSIRAIWPQSGDTVVYSSNNVNGSFYCLVWQPVFGADRYWVQIASDSSFSSMVFSDSIFTAGVTLDSISFDGTIYYYHPLNIQRGMYYWRVMAINSYGRSPWSAVWNFWAVETPPSAWKSTINYFGKRQYIYIPESGMIKIGSRSFTRGDCFGTFFTRNDSLICYRYYGGYDVSELLMSCGGDDSTTSIKDGFSTEDTIVVKIWDGFEAKEYNARILCTRGVPTFVGSITDTLVSIETTTLVQTSVEQENQMTVPQQFSLSQNYPNPFNPSTEIRYTLPTDVRVQLEVFNILGQRVATLVNEEQKAGYYKKVFDASSFSSGVYFYRLSAGTFMKTGKMQLLK